MIYFPPPKKLTLQNFLACMAVCVAGIVLFLLPDFLKEPCSPPSPYVPPQVYFSRNVPRIPLYDVLDGDMQEGIRLANLFDYDGAVAELNKTIAKFPTNSDALCWRGFCYMKLNKDSNALKDFNLAIKNGNKAWPYYERGRLYHQQDRFDESISDLTKAIELFPSYSRAYSERGYVKFLGKLKIDDAVRDLNKAIQMDPQNSDAYIDRGIVYWFCGAYCLAIADTDRGLSLNPQAFHGYQVRGFSKQRIGFYTSAISDFKTILAYMEQRNATEQIIGIQKHIGDCQIGAGNYELAFETYSNVVEQDPSYYWKIPCDLIQIKAFHFYRDAKFKFHNIEMPTTIIRIEGLSDAERNKRYH